MFTYKHTYLMSNLKYYQVIYGKYLVVFYLSSNNLASMVADNNNNTCRQNKRPANDSTNTNIYHNITH